MTSEETQLLANEEHARIQKIDSSARKLSKGDLNKELQRVIEEHRPLHEKKVKLAMRMMILSRELRLRLLREAYPNAKVEYVTVLCDLEPTDHVIGNTEEWIEKIKAAGLNPTRLLVDKTRMSIRVME